MKCIMKEFDEIPQMKDILQRMNKVFIMEKESLIKGFLMEKELLIKRFRNEKEALGKEFIMEKESLVNKLTENFNKDIWKYKVYILFIILIFLIVIGVIYYKYIFGVIKFEEYCPLQEK